MAHVNSTVTRRNFLTMSSMVAATLYLSACRAAGERISNSDLPESLSLPADTPNGALAPLIRLLNRAGYGPRPGELERVASLGIEAYLEEQLNPAAIDDAACDVTLRNLTYYPMDITQLLAQEPEDIALDFGASTITRGLLSKRQLYESMVEFWSDHFNIYVRKNENMLPLKVVDDREVIRPHALGKFRDLLAASAHSPAMLVYLDNVQNLKGAPNENYAREIMELHSLGVHGGYTQQDVQELSRALTGWGVRKRGRQQGLFFFNPDEHDDGEKLILGRTFPSGQGQADVEQVLEMLVTHAATAKFIAFKLVRRFVADEPPQPLIDQVAQVFIDTDGDIKSMLRTIFLSADFASAPPKLKRPYTYTLSALRALGANLGTFAPRVLQRWLTLMGQPLYLWPPPDGYPDVSQSWAAALLPRWNFALALMANQMDAVSIPFDRLVNASGTDDVTIALDAFAGVVLGRPLDAQAGANLRGYIGSGSIKRPLIRKRLGESIALMLASPAFQWT
jgi:uncharacterized protein (DUF1800 family)